MVKPTAFTTLVYLVGPSGSLRALQAYMNQVKPQRFQRGYGFEYFERPELAWASLSEARKKRTAWWLTLTFREAL